MAMNETQTQIATKQAEYDELVEANVAKRKSDRDARRKLETKFEADLKQLAGGGDDLLQRKFALTLELNDLKNQRVGEIVADVSLGVVVKSVAIAELQALGYTAAAAEIELRRATGDTIPAEAPMPSSQGPTAPDLQSSVIESKGNVAPTNVNDPASENEANSRLEILSDDKSPEGLKKAAELKAAEAQRLEVQKTDQEEAEAASRRAEAQTPAQTAAEPKENSAKRKK